MEAGPGDEWPDLFQGIRQRRIKSIVERNRDRMKRRDIDVLGNSMGFEDLDTQESGVASKRMRADNDAAKPEYPGLRECEQHLSRLSVHPRQAALAAHPSEPAALFLALLEILVDLLGSLNTLSDLIGIRSEIALDRMVREPLDRIPVLAPTPLAKDRRATELQNGILLEAREHVRVGRLDRQWQSSRMCAFNHLRLAQRKYILLGNLLGAPLECNRYGDVGSQEAAMPNKTCICWATHALKSGLCCLRFFIADLLSLKTSRHQIRGLRRCPISEE